MSLRFCPRALDELLWLPLSGVFSQSHSQRENSFVLSLLPRFVASAWFLFLGVLCCILPPATLAQSPPSAPCVAPEVHEALRSEGRAVVFVNCRGVRRLATGDAPGSDPAPVLDEEGVRSVLRGVEEALAPFGNGSQCHFRFRWIPSMLLEVRDGACLRRLETLDCVESVHLDLRGTGSLRESAPALGAIDVHNMGVRGDGRVTAILDTGIDSDHPDFSGAILHEFHFLNQLRKIGLGAEDDQGHGTNVAGIVASRGVRSPPGIAPASDLVILKVLNRDNVGWISDWTAAVEHVITLHQANNGIRVDVINMSFGTDVLYRGTCDATQAPFLAACRRAVELGMTVVAAAGNNAADDRLPVPACFSPVISVGSIQDTASSVVSTFSNLGPELDLLAPGETITSAGRGGGTSSYRGTSQAAPHVAALACLLRQIDSRLTPAEVLDILSRTGGAIFSSRARRSFPVVDALAAARTALLPRLLALDASEEFGTLVVEWRAEARPHHFVVRVKQGGALVYREDLGGSERSFRFTPSSPAVFDVEVSVADGAGHVGVPSKVTVPLQSEASVFVRGECDGRGGINLTDSVYLLNFLFLDGQEPDCLEGCNANGDVRLNVADVTHALGYLFLQGANPEAPFPQCGLAVPFARLGCTSSVCP